MKPIHNYIQEMIELCDVVIPHKVNDLIETNSQRNGDDGTNNGSCDSSQS